MSVDPVTQPRSADAVVGGALGAVWNRIFDRVEAQLRPAERLVEHLLEGWVDPETRAQALEALTEASAWLADLGMVAAARGSRALRENVEQLPADAGRDVGLAVVMAALIEGVRASVETVGATGTNADAIGDRLLVVGQASVLLDNVIWFAAASGFAVEQSAGLDRWPADPHAIVVVDTSVGSLAATLLACRAATEADVPVIVATDRSSPRDRSELAQFASSLLSASVRTAEIVDEVRRHLHAIRRPREMAIRGPEADALVPALASRGLDAWSADTDGELLVGLESGRASGVLLLPADDNDAMVRLLRSQPATRQLTIVEVLEDGRDEAAAAGVDATIETVDAILPRAGQLAELLRQRADLELDVTGLRRAGGVPWASASFLAERVLLSAHRSESVATVCVIRYGIDEDVAAIDGVQEALMREFRTDDIVTRNGDRENILVLGSVGAPVAHARFEGIIERASTAGARVGIAEFPHHEQSLGDLVDAARNAIDRASAVSGAPRVVTADWHPDRQRGAEVVIADSDPASGHVVMRSLDRVGLTAEHVSDGEMLLERLRDVSIEPPRLLILEFDLLGVDGLTVLRRLSDRATLRRLDVVMLSSRARETDVREAYDLGVADVIEKPFSPGILVRRLLRVLEVEP